MRLAIVGATGLVGQEMFKVLHGRGIYPESLIPVASEKSVGKHLTFAGQDLVISDMESALNARPDIAIFSAGGKVSLDFAPKFSEVGSVVIDNSSAWRMDREKKLIVPEVNGHVLTPEDRIIANPNCSTIQMVLALAPLHKKYGIRRIVVSTYQSVTGTGKDAVEQLENERSGRRGRSVYPHPIDLNALPHIDVFLENGYTKEEMKMVHETRKILQDETMAITATAVRLPVIGGHSEAVNVEFYQDFELSEVRDILEHTSGLVVQDDPLNNVYPMPINARNKDEVFVGRIRRDESQPKALNLWIVADNLRKGAATNAIQIMEHLLENKLVSA